MGRKFIFLVGYFSSIFIILLVFAFGSISLSNQKNSNTIQRVQADQNSITYAAIPISQEPFSVSVGISDKRTQILENFFSRYDSPLQGFGDTIVKDADKYGLDYRLLPAIAMQESTLCQIIPKNSYNCWGYGIYGGHAYHFSDYNDAINTVSKSLAHEYVAKGLQNPEEIMKKYTPSSNGSWAQNVSYVMQRLSIGL